MTIVHPLPINTRVYYEDFDGGNGTIILNDNTTDDFVSAVVAFNLKYHTPHNIAPILADELDYCIRFDDEPDELLPVQRGGILRVLNS